MQVQANPAGAGRSLGDVGSPDLLLTTVSTSDTDFDLIYGNGFPAAWPEVLKLTVFYDVPTASQESTVDALGPGRLTFEAPLDEIDAVPIAVHVRVNIDERNKDAVTGLLDDLVARGLIAHPMAGFDVDGARQAFGLDAGQGLVVAVSLAVSLLTLFSMSKIWNGAFWGEVELVVEPDDGPTARWGATVPMLGATGVLVAVSVALAVFAGPLYSLCERASTALLDPLTAFHHEADFCLQPAHFGAGFIQLALGLVDMVARSVVRLADGFQVGLDAAQVGHARLQVIDRLFRIGLDPRLVSFALRALEKPQLVLLQRHVSLERVVLLGDFGLLFQLFQVVGQLTQNIFYAGQVLAGDGRPPRLVGLRVKQCAVALPCLVGSVAA